MSPPPASRHLPDPGPRKRMLFRVGTALALVLTWGLSVRVVRAIAVRLAQPPAELSPAASPDERPGDTLRIGCAAHGAECAELYGGRPTLCYRPACAGPWDFTSTPQGLVGPIDRMYERTRPPGIYRILALGGSTTAGRRWEEAWPARLETLLERRARDEGLSLRFELLNLGLSGGGSGDSLALYDAIGRGFEADLLIVGEEVNDLGGCGPFSTASAGERGGNQEQLVARFLEGAPEVDLEALRALSPWFAGHASAYEAERSRRQAAGAIATLGEALGLTREALNQVDGTEWKARCWAPSSVDLGRPSIFDDFADGWEYTRRSYDALRRAAREAGIPRVVFSTTPHAFEVWRCPAPSCAPVLDLADWARYITRVHNPELRRYVDADDAELVDLERGIDAFARGDPPTHVPVSWILHDYRRALALDEAELEDRFRAGRIGKGPLFKWEWMHPSVDGDRLVAALYLEALWPAILEHARGVTAP